MSERLLIEPDVNFVHTIREQGGEALKLCCQCATCSVTCQISPQERPFPRKEMIWVQWGLRDRLLADPDIWLCYQCNDCSVNCPRQSKPGDILASVREFAFRHFAFPKFMGLLVSVPKFLPLVFLIPIVLLLGVTALFGNPGIPAGPVVYSRVFPLEMIDSFFITGVVLVFIATAVGLSQYWRQMCLTAHLPGSNGRQGGSFMKSVCAAVKEVLTHSQFGECSDNRSRQWGHLLVFYSFIGLFITTSLVAYMTWFMEYHPPFESLLHPVKLLGNLSSLAILSGLVILFYLRITGSDKVGRSTYTDWLFFSLLTFTILTGVCSEIFRLTGLAVTAYTTYFFHLVFVFTLLLYLPYTKFAHMLYRITATVFDKYTGRNARQGD